MVLLARWAWLAFVLSSEMKILLEDSGLIFILGKVVDCEFLLASGHSSSEMFA